MRSLFPKTRRPVRLKKVYVQITVAGPGSGSVSGSVSGSGSRSGFDFRKITYYRTWLFRLGQSQFIYEKIRLNCNYGPGACCLILIIYFCSLIFL